MNKLKLFDGGYEKKLTYTDRVTKGIFLVADTKIARENCKLFNIGLQEGEREYSMKVSKIDKAAIVSTRVDKEYYQYVILNYVEQKDFQDFLNEAPTQVKQALTMAYNMNKVNTLDGLSHLETLGNVN